VVIQNGQSVASFLNHLRDQLTGLQTDVSDRVTSLATDANGLAQQVADLNATIIQAEGGAGIANGLRDQRDSVLKQLSQLMNIKTVQQPNGTVDVYVGSEPLVMAAENRGVSTKDDTSNPQLAASVIFKANNGTMNIASGQLGALGSVQEQISSVAANIDKVAGSLIFELNKIHSAGQGLQGFSTTTGANGVNDPTVPLNNKLAGLKFSPVNGSFVVHVKNKTTGLMTSSLVKVDLDGLNSNDTTLNSLVADLGAITGVTASINAGKLVVSAAGSDSEISFSQDSSGALAALGMNSFFTGSTARDIGVNPTIVDAPTLLAAAKNGEQGDNQTALAIAALETKSLAAMSGVSLKDNYQSIVNGVATRASAAKTAAEGAAVVQQTLQAQRESLSGVSLDEEAVNLMRQQRAYQGAARLITVVNELMDEMMSMVR
jgi:flagellar hook-associated protein 1 FlgK